METIGVKINEEEHSLGKIQVPRTYFLLTAEEQERYDEFRVEHDRLRVLPRGTATTEQNNALSDMFLNVVGPYLDRLHLKSYGSFTTYGEERQTLLRLPPQSLSSDGDDSKGLVDPGFWFSTENKNLSCKSYLSYTSQRHSQASVVYDIFERVVKQQKQDGTNFPFVMRQGFVYFGSSDFFLGLTMVVGDIVNRIGPEKMEELCVLYDSYIQEASSERGGFSDRTRKDATIKKEVFRNAYASSLEIALLEAGLI
ncbi:hypothetical protein HY212_00765 [Candidatus Pacearchaeota archaeon]|nr:hypothetical protein [Candidatus Pacearchaeota archaeon]